MRKGHIEKERESLWKKALRNTSSHNRTTVTLEITEQEEKGETSFNES